MAISDEQIVEIKQWLGMRHVIVPVEWVQACVTFLVQEYRDLLTSNQRLKNHVYDQWLVADLEEIGVSALPLDISSCQKKLLNGFFALQVNGIRDVGKPAYTQLRDLEGRTNSDVEVSATPRAFAPEWEAKPTRMLIMNLTDGVTNVQGMEYKTITSLSPNLPPGFKVLIKGPCECRFGHLLLTADNIEVLGGEVDKHQEKYSREQILRDALQLNPATDTRSESDSENLPDHHSRNQRNISSNRNQVQQPSFIVPAAHNRPSPPVTSSNNTSDLSEVPENFDAIDDNDDFIQDLDYSVLDEIERVNSQQNTDPQEPETTDSHSVLDQSRNNEAKIPDESSAFCHQSSQNYVDSSAPFTYLDAIPTGDSNKKEFSITIRGSISKVLSKLECKAIGRWHLTARVQDSRSFIDVDFHDQVLEKFVGVSAKEMTAMQIEARNNPRMREKVTGAISSMKKTLQQLHCLMEIKFSPGQNPCVVKCSDN